MKKILIFSLLSLFLLPLLYISKVNAIDLYQLDQSQLLSEGFAPVYSDLGINQTFKPLKNVLTRIDISMVNRIGGSNIILTVKDENTGEIVVTTNQRMDPGDGWEVFDLLDDQMGYVLDTSHRYSMWISTNKYPEPFPAWLFSTNPDSYTRGFMRSGTTTFEGDFVFKTYGYDIDFGRVNPDPIIPAVEPVDEEVVPAQEESNEPLATDKLVDEIQEKTVTPDTPVDTFELNEEDIDDSVEIPVLEFVIVDNLIVDHESKEGVTVEQEEILKITGTAGASDTVAVTIGTSIYTATADEKGNWYVIVSAKDLIKGTHTVTAQSKNPEGKGSMKADLFKLNVTDGTETLVGDTQDEENTLSKYLPYAIYSLAALLILALIVFFIYQKKKKEAPLKEKSSPAVSNIK